MDSIEEVKDCTVMYCPNAHYAKGLCTRHYANLRRTGMVVPRDDSRYIMAIAMVILRENLPTEDYNRAISEAWEVAKSDVPNFAQEFEALLLEARETE